jgi:hypothetical protein
MVGTRFGWLLVIGTFIAVGYLARQWASSSVSPATQYLGLGLYVVAQAIIFVPILWIAKNYAGPNVIPAAAIMTLTLFGALRLRPREQEGLLVPRPHALCRRSRLGCHPGARSRTQPRPVFMARMTSSRATRHYNLESSTATGGASTSRRPSPSSPHRLRQFCAILQPGDRRRRGRRSPARRRSPRRWGKASGPGRGVPRGARAGPTSLPLPSPRTTSAAPRPPFRRPVRDGLRIGPLPGA